MASLKDYIVPRNSVPCPLPEYKLPPILAERLDRITGTTFQRYDEIDRDASAACVSDSIKRLLELGYNIERRFDGHVITVRYVGTLVRGPIYGSEA